MEREEVKKILEECIKTIKAKGLVISLKYKKPNIYQFVSQFQSEHDLSCPMETMYWILNDIQKKPICKGYNKKCIKTLKFRHLHDGYSPSCKNCAISLPETQQKMKESLLKNHPLGFKDPAILQKRVETSRKKYGVDSPNQAESVKKKRKETKLEHWGKAGFAHPNIKKKRVDTAIEKYGVTHHTKLEEVQDKKRKTLQDKYGVDNIMLVPEVAKKVSRSWYENRPGYLEYVQKIVESKNLELVSDYKTSHAKITVKCKKCNNNFEILWNSFQQGGGVCPHCYPSSFGKSFQESEIAKLISNENIEVTRNRRDLISPYELDIVIESKKIAVEHCGLWCHSSGGEIPANMIKDKKYHLTKLEMCNNIGYRLITIFEDEWILYKRVVISRLLYSLDKSKSKKVAARNCVIRNLSFKEKSEFLLNFHLQGDKISKINLGIFYEDILLAVMTFSESVNLYFELERYCCHPDYRILGAASKLLVFFKRNYNWNTIISYADRRWSSGNLYNQLGFQLDSITEPNYWYWGPGIKGRSHRLKFRKDKLREFNSFKENLTEFQIMSLEKFAWIYDCGNLKYKMSK